MFDGLVPLGFSLRRVAVSLRGIEQQVRRVADALEMQSGAARGVGLRSFYRDDRPGAVDEAAVLTQTDDDYARYERAEGARRRAGRPVADDEDLDGPEEGWRG